MLQVVSNSHLHVGANSEQEPQVHAQRPDVGASLAGHPEHHEMAVVVVRVQLDVVDGADSQLPLNRADERRSLEERPCSAGLFG